MDYKERLRLAKEALESGSYDKETIEYIFPELKESKDEKMRAMAIKAVYAPEAQSCIKSFGINPDDVIAWIENQKTSNEALQYLKENHSPSEMSDFQAAMNIAVAKAFDAGKKQGEQKFAAKVEPKFKIGDKIVEKDFDECGCGTIIGIKDGKYIFDDGSFIYIEEQGLWKLIEQNPAELPKGEDYGIDGLYAAIDILQKTLGKVEGYQTDDGILGHKCAISAVKKLYEQHSAWSEEDEHRVSDTIYFLDTAKKHYASTIELDSCIDWLKSLKDRVQPQKEWSEEDRIRIANCIQLIGKTGDGEVEWLKSLESRILPQAKPEWSEENSPYYDDICEILWKPSDEQMDALNYYLENDIDNEGVFGHQLVKLYQDLKKLK